MAGTDINETIHYHSLFRHGVDAKRRLQIPAKWLPAGGNVTFTLILWRNGSQPDTNLLVLPPAEMKALAEKLKPLPFTDPNATALRRLIGSKSASVDVDQGGRICIPDEMAKAAGIKGEAILVGLVDRFEIWNPERYETVQTVDEALLPEAFKLI